jgi:formylglycine-generating enzyme required for sulfatase activity
MKWFVGAAALLVGLSLVAVFFPGSKKEKPSSAARIEKPPEGANVRNPPAVAQPVPAEVGQATEKARLAAEAQAVEQARLESEKAAERLNEAKRIAEEQAKTEAAARAAEERAKTRLAAEAEAKRLTEEKAKSEDAAAHEAARLKAQAAAQEKVLLAVDTETKAPKYEDWSAAPFKSPESEQMTNSLGMVFVRMPANYWVGKFEVTQTEYETIMGVSPSRPKVKTDPRLPVESVSWNDAMKFCQALTAKEKAAGTLPAGTVYALPTQQQWNEYVGHASIQAAVTSDNGQRTAPAPDNPFFNRGFRCVLAPQPRSSSP